jgi:hypothetical protein
LLLLLWGSLLGPCRRYLGYLLVFLETFQCSVRGREEGMLTCSFFSLYNSLHFND